MDGSANAARMPELVSGIERVKRIANSTADIADQLHGQANRLFGTPPPEPASTTGSTVGKVADDGSLLMRLADVFETIERNLQRAQAGATRLADLG